MKFFDRFSSGSGYSAVQPSADDAAAPEDRHDIATSRPRPRWWRDGVKSNFGKENLLLPSKLSLDGKGLLGNLLLAFIPSFLQPYFMSQKDPQSAPQSSTAWLNGLRGYAALLVTFCHFFMVYYQSTRFAYGTVIPEGTTLMDGNLWLAQGELIQDGVRITVTDPYANVGILQLPILRLILAGDAMVNVFFIVSGYSLSIKPIRQIRQYSLEALLRTLASSIFRRAPRLLTPCILASFMIALAVQMGAFSYASTFAGDLATFHTHFHGHAWEPMVYIAPTFVDQMRHWLEKTSFMLDFFTHHHWPLNFYDPHQWTIPVELKCSLFLYLTQAGTALLTTRSRQIVLWILIVGALTWGDMFEMALFWAGMALCELDTIRHERSSESGSLDRVQRPRLRGLKKRWALIGLAGCYLMSFPVLCADLTPFYSFLAKLPMPGVKLYGEFRFWASVGSMLTVCAIAHSPLIMKFLSNRFATYLGRISYAIYLCHGFIFRAFSQGLTYTLWNRLGYEDHYDLAIFISFIASYVVVIYVADMFCRCIDEPIIDLTRKLENVVKRRDPAIVETAPSIPMIGLTAP